VKRRKTTTTAPAAENWKTTRPITASSEDEMNAL
jgi:hypothetical protein